MIILPRDTSSVLWRKSRRSQEHGACVEVGDFETVIAIRDSKNVAVPALVMRRTTFALLACGLKS